MTCREWLGIYFGFCKRQAETATGGLCLEHIAERQLWEQRMARRGQ